jgi:DNA (cytosine-5)-methyltransferase 1
MEHLHVGFVGAGLETGNMERGMVERPDLADARRYLYQELLADVACFQPRMFVLENVLGMKAAAGGQFFTRV